MITFAQLQNESSKLYPGIFLEKFSTYYSRNIVRKTIFWLMILSFIASLIEVLTPQELYQNISFIIEYRYQIRSLFFLLLSVWMLFLLIRMFYFSFYFRESSVDFEVAKLVLRTDKKDMTKSFLKSYIGEYALMRLGLGSEQIKNFLSNRRGQLGSGNFDIDLSSKDKKQINIRDYFGTLYDLDKEFSNFLIQYKVDRETFIGALEWVDDIEWKVRNAERWWNKSNLARVQGIGRNWSFGKVYLLEKYGDSIMSDQIYRDLGNRWKMFERDAQKVESVLVKNRGANVALVSPTTSIGMQIVAALGKMILFGKVLFEIEHKRIFVLDTVKIIETAEDPVQLERLVRDILFQADAAGNVILVIPNLPIFDQRASEIGVDVSNLISDFLRSSRMQIIAISDNKGFHSSIETNTDLMQHFEKVLIEDINKESAIKILEDEANRIEVQKDVFFTFQSIKTIAEGAERYFVGATYSDKIIDLIDEIVAGVKSDGRKVVLIEDAHNVISKKTGVPQGDISKDEKQTLKNLEEILHRRVVGQNQAIDAISNSMRRSRSGIADPKRPMGSFLFIGPTGVGKTETVKALNQVFFREDGKIIRLDMSEYTGEDAIEKLIGSYSSKTSGILADKIQDQQYGVLLLDEFEKTTDRVKDLFLQILDEGQFQDSEGEKINCRNLIIVATSNAGSDLIYKASVAGENIAGMKDQIVDQIIADQIFKPELLNRFDEVILFHALTEEHLQKIARLMLERLNERISRNGLKINIDDKIINYLVKIGSDPKFGAREMNRKIKEQVESLIANKIISNEIKGGDTLTLTFDNSGNPDLIPNNE